MSSNALIEENGPSSFNCQMCSAYPLEQENLINFIADAFSICNNCRALLLQQSFKLITDDLPNIIHTGWMINLTTNEIGYMYRVNHAWWLRAFNIDQPIISQMTFDQVVIAANDPILNEFIYIETLIEILCKKSD